MPLAETVLSTLFERLIRAGIIVTGDWVTLRFFEEAPWPLILTLLAISGVGFIVLEKKETLQKIGWYAIAIVAVVSAYSAVCVYAYATLPSKGASEHQAPVQTTVPAPSAPVTVRPVVINGSPIGPITTLQMRELLGAKAHAIGIAGPDPGPSPIDFHWAVAFTAPQENMKVVDFLYRLMIAAGLNVARLQIPDHSVNLDSPPFPGPGDRGITLHGENALNERLFGVLQYCLNVGVTKNTVDGLEEWYRKQTVPDQIIVWIEIGHGSPWKQPGCLE